MKGRTHHYTFHTFLLVSLLREGKCTASLHNRSTRIARTGIKVGIYRTVILELDSMLLELVSISKKNKKQQSCDKD